MKKSKEIEGNRWKSKEMERNQRKSNEIERNQKKSQEIEEIEGNLRGCDRGGAFGLTHLSFLDLSKCGGFSVVDLIRNSLSHMCVTLMQFYWFQ